MSMRRAHACLEKSSIPIGIRLGNGSRDDTYILVAFPSYLYTTQDVCKDCPGICKSDFQIGSRSFVVV